MLDPTGVGHELTRSGGIYMWYEVNVSLHGKHLFTTDKHSITDLKNAVDIVALIKEKFPEEEGYEVRVTEWQQTGTMLKLVCTNGLNHFIEK